MGRWYRIDEKKPKTRKIRSEGPTPDDVIYFRESKPILVCYYDKESKEQIVTCGNFVVNSDGTECWLIDNFTERVPATHWARMPKPPKL